MPCYRTAFQGVIHWPHLDFSTLGREKQFVGVDIIADAPEGVNVSIGYDQLNRSNRTDEYLVDADTLTGQLVAIPVAGPSFDVRLTFEPEQQWKWSATIAYLQDMAGAR